MWGGPLSESASKNVFFFFFFFFLVAAGFYWPVTISFVGIW
ncbi:unnamed protein product [Ixodes persulcatus]